MSEHTVSTCPFCERESEGGICAHCGRDPTGRRRVCDDCKKITPSGEPICCHCGKRFRTELAWKIPAIIVMFVVAAVLSVVIRIAFD
jgi:RNA polymerase subunit RPABC4/transcription elongation factor Spt4